MDAHESVFARQSLDVRQERDDDFVIDVRLVPVHGRVLLGDDPIAADLWFGGRNASVSVKLASDDTGAFDGALPKDGPWTVQVSGRSPTVETLATVNVHEGEEITLRLLDTVVRGRVIDPEGGPIDSVDVTARVWGGRIVVTRADANGSFEFHGLPEGKLEFQATDQRTRRQSRPLTTELKRDSPLDRITLELRSQRGLSGRLLSRATPVVGAHVSVAPFAGDKSYTQSQLVSNEEGAFELMVPDDADHAWIVVSAPGRTLQNFAVPLTGDPLRLEIEPLGGTLDLVWPKDRFPQVARAGVPLMPGDLVAWARRHGESLHEQRLRIPGVAPGPIRACIVQPGTSDARSGLQCKEGVLAPGGSLMLDVSAK